MKKTKILFLILFLLGMFAFPSSVSAQTYRFEVTTLEVAAYIEEDGTLSLWYLFDFHNSPNADPIDFVDIGMPSASYSLAAIAAEVDEKPITVIESSPYVPNGFALGLESNAIEPGQTGRVTIWVSGIRNVLSNYDSPDRENYTNFQFTPTWFDPKFDKSKNTNYRMTIILPPGIGDDEGVYYKAVGWPGDPLPDDTGRTTSENRVYYSWFTDNANAHTEYQFGAAFPSQFVPDNIQISEVPVTTIPGTSSGSPGVGFLSFLLNNICCAVPGVSVFVIFIVVFLFGNATSKKRKMEYLPPKMKIEGNGIKRGLTAVEAAILMEQPMDKTLTMILFGVLKKEAATVTQEDPLELVLMNPLPDGLHQYEIDFLEAFKLKDNKRKAAMQKMLVDLINSVSLKMKGFSHKETVAYYEDIMRRAWKLVEESETPEVKSERYNQTMEWTMLDKDYQDRTQRTFTSGPVFVPMWWPRYSPSYRRSIGGTVTNPVPTASTSTPSAPSGGGKISLPNIPGSNFAAGVIHGTTAMAAGVVGNLTSFTNSITTRTNPIPVSSSSGSGGFRGGSGGGSSCACACACAGCACACAGGGR